MYLKSLSWERERCMLAKHAPAADHALASRVTRATPRRDQHGRRPRPCPTRPDAGRPPGDPSIPPPLPFPNKNTSNNHPNASLPTEWYNHHQQSSGRHRSSARQRPTHARPHTSITIETQAYTGRHHFSAAASSHSYSAQEPCCCMPWAAWHGQAQLLCAGRPARRATPGLV